MSFGNSSLLANLLVLLSFNALLSLSSRAGDHFVPLKSQRSWRSRVIRWLLFLLHSSCSSVYTSVHSQFSVRRALIYPLFVAYCLYSFFVMLFLISFLCLAGVSMAGNNVFNYAKEQPAAFAEKTNFL